MDKNARTQMIPRAEEVPILDVPDAGRLAFGLGRAASYQAVHRGDLPSIRCGRRIVVPTAALRRLLGLDQAA
jgi:hypothetical protein